MKGFTWLVCNAVVLALASAPVLGSGEEGTEVKPGASAGATPVASAAPRALPDANAGDFDLMVRYLNLTEEQQAKLKEKFAAMEKALAEWDKQALGTAEKLDEAIEKARKVGNTDELTRLVQQKLDLSPQRAKLVEKLMEDVLSVLTPEQRLEWAGLKLYLEMLRNYRVLQLTDDQLFKLMELCRQAAKDEGVARDKDASVALVRAKLLKDIKEQVLTQEQRDKLEGKKAPWVAPAPAQVTPPPPPKDTPKKDTPKKPKNPKNPKGTVKTL